MNRREHDAVERVLAEEFGLTHIDDSDELRSLLRAKMAEMNALDRAALDMRVGRILSEAESGGSLKSRYKLLSFATLALIAWFVWRPLPVVLAIFAASNIRSFAIRRALFWTPRTAVAIGGVYGILLAVLVCFGIALTNHTITAGVVLGVSGFFAAGYIGFGVPTGRSVQTPGDEKRLLAQMAALGCYLVLVIALLLWHFWGSTA